MTKIPIYGFMHYCTINHFRDIMKEQFFKLTKYGLYENTTSISLGLTRSNETEETLNLPKKMSIGHNSPNKNEFEFPTISLLYNHCLTHDCLVWYTHSKGVWNTKSWHPVYGSSVEWRHSMEKSILINWKTCVEILLKHNKDTCGYGLQTWDGHWIYAGNFWWAKSSYIRTLKNPIKMNLKDRFDSERWILYKNRVQSMKHIDINRYISTKKKKRK